LLTDDNSKAITIAEKFNYHQSLILLHLWHTRIEAFMLEHAGILPQPTEDAGFSLMNADTA